MEDVRVKCCKGDEEDVMEEVSGKLNVVQRKREGIRTDLLSLPATNELFLLLLDVKSLTFRSD
jgi:hypothetical protein